MLLPTDYNLIFWAHGKRDAISLTESINRLFATYGSNYNTVYYGQEKIKLDPMTLNSVFDDGKSEQGLLAIGLKAENGLVLRITIDSNKAANTLFPQTLRIGFNKDHLQGSKPFLTFEQLVEIFRFCLRIFKPYYAYVAEDGEINYSLERQQRRRNIDIGKVPVAIEWFNYFDERWSDRLGGENKLLLAPVFLTESVKELNGITLILQKEPFDYKNPDHLQKRQAVEDYLDFKQLHQAFRK